LSSPPLSTCPGKNYDEFRNLVLASQLKPVNQAEMSQLFSGGSGGDASAVGSIKSRVGNAGAMNKAFNIGHRGDGGIGSGGGVSNVGGGILGGSYDPSMAAAQRGRAVLAAASSTTSTAKRGGGSLFDQSNPAELEGLDWKQLQKKMAKKGKRSSKKTIKAQKLSRMHVGMAAPSASSPPNINPQQFEREWRRSCTDAAATARYLLRTDSLVDGATGDGSVRPRPMAGSKRRLVLRPEEASRTVFKVELGSDVMGDILAALVHLCRLPPPPPSSLGGGLAAGEEYSSSNNSDACTGRLSFRPSFVYRWMIAMTKCGRFGLNISFLTGEQKQDVEYIVATLEKHIGGGDDAADDDECCGGFTEEDVMRVRELYK